MIMSWDTWSSWEWDTQQDEVSCNTIPSSLLTKLNIDLPLFVRIVFPYKQYKQNQRYATYISKHCVIG